MLIPFFFISLRFPAKYLLPSQTPVTPSPVMLSNSFTLTSDEPFRYLTTASARGCSDSFSRLKNMFLRYVSRDTFVSCAPEAESASLFMMSDQDGASGREHIRCVTSGRPSVTVPVLSRTTVSIFLAVSMLSASLISMPFSAPFPMPTIMAVGVASPSAHGHAIISTVTIARSPCVTPFSPSRTAHRMNERRAIPIMTGTKTAAILSTSFWTGALLPCASWTIAIIFDRRVSVPTLSARNLKLPFWFIVPAKTFESFRFATGTGSPLSMLSSTYELPSVTVPSTATLSPGFTAMMSPGLTAPTGISIYSIGQLFPLDITVTVLGCSPISFFIASDVFPLAFSSISLPKRMRAIITLEASK